MSALDAFIYNPSTTGNKFLSSKHDSWVSGVRGHSATYWPQSQLNNSRYNKKKKKANIPRQECRKQVKVSRRNLKTNRGNSLIHTHTPTHHLLPVVRSWDWMTHPSGYTECVCVCVLPCRCRRCFAMFGKRWRRCRVDCWHHPDCLHPRSSPWEADGKTYFSVFPPVFTAWEVCKIRHVAKSTWMLSMNASALVVWGKS